MEKQVCNCKKTKVKPRSDQEKQALRSRVNRIIGQLSGVNKMIDEDRYCDDVLTQLAAIDKAVRSVSTLILKEHMRTCLVSDVLSGNTEVIDEVVELFRRFQ